MAIIVGMLGGFFGVALVRRIRGSLNMLQSFVVGVISGFALVSFLAILGVQF